MKKSCLFLFALMLCTLTALAQTATLRVGDTTTEYTGSGALVSAYNAAPDEGGVITLSAGSFSAITISKSVEIYGAGFDENSTDLTKITSAITINAGKVRIENLWLVGNIDPGDKVYAVDELLINKCRMQTITFYTDFKKNATIRNSVITQAYMHYTNGSPDYESVKFENSIIHHFHSWINDQTLGNTTFNHCIVLGATNGSGFWDIPKFKFTNSIIPNVLQTGGVADHCVFACDEFTGSTLTDCKFGVSSTDLFGVEDLYGMKRNMTHAYRPAETYELLTPASYIGSDNTEIGVYGGDYPWKGIDVAISGAGYATYTTPQRMNFAKAEATLKAYTVAVDKNGKLTKTQVGKVDKGVPLLLEAVNGGATTGEVPTVSTFDAIAGNDLVAVNSSVANLATTDAEGNTNYILWMDSENPVGFYRANNQYVAAGKAYLRLSAEKPSAAKAFAYMLEGGTATGISAMTAPQGDDSYYNLQGQRVEQPGRGIYIKGGKKIIVK